MEWSWLKDWWRLKKLRKLNRRHNVSDQCNGQTHHGQESGSFDDDDDDEDYCYCDECMNGDIDLCGEPSDGVDDSDGSVCSNSGKQVVVGICAMAKKSQSKPMKEILTRLQEFEYIKMMVFPEDVILKEPVENWPLCDCLISFHSKGFPLEKAIQYAQLRKPYVINNLHMQYDIQDRRKVYSILESEGIEIPRYAVLDRDSPDPKQHELVESEDHVEVNGIIFNKPFVEKPVSAEDHNIYIYYPTSAGGGSQRLFRKIGSRSSVYSPESRVRKTGSFIYEDFMPTDGKDWTDVKVYTVGPDYAHAEARKSPALDGKVERDSEGKEIRYPVILSNAEKLISRKVCLAFKQTVCGFDLLRANGKSYVCDVNGFSFVKNSNKYYDDCAKILGNMILRELTPTLHIPWSVPFQLDDPPIVPTTFGKMMELRCVVAIIRHGDRTPKQKMKVEVRHPKFFEIFEKYDGYKHGHVKLKRPKQLQEILDIARALLADIHIKAAEPEIEEKQGKLEQLKSVLEMYGHFSGINRKVQMKYQPKGRPRGSSSDDDAPKEPSLVLILKWGGELTPAGRIQAEELGRIFRCMYPGGQGRNEYSGTQGLGLLRLHSTFRHDLKIYASDEGRVQMTAAAFAKGLLALEGELTPILVQMVKSANTNGLLDNDCDCSKYQNMAKNRLHEMMQIDREFTDEDREAINPSKSISIHQAMEFVKNPAKCCSHVQSLIQNLLNVINVKREDAKTRDAILYHGETWDLMGRRWGKIEKDFSTKSKTFDISKIPDIYDCIKYDLQHNQHTLQFDQAEELYMYAKYLADIVIPQEYGLTIQEKLTIGQGICTPLLKKIKADLQRNIEEVGDESVNRLNPRYSHGVSSPGRHVRTRLYFTSESHVHSLLTVLRFGGLLNVLTDEQWRRAMEYISMVSELNYMSQIVIMLYEDPTKDPSSEERFHVELHFSPGVNCCVQKNLPPGPGFRPHSRNDSATSKNSGDDDLTPTRIEEENDTPSDEPGSNDLSPDGTTPLREIVPLPKISRPRYLKMSKPIPIGSHHTVSGHEASELAKRLTEQLAHQHQLPSGSLGVHRALSPDTEPRSRSYDQKGPKTKDHTMTTATSSSPPSSGGSVTCTEAGGAAGSAASSSSATHGGTSRRQRHSIAGQMSYYKMLGFGGFGKKMAASTNSLFSTAVISGSSSAPNLRDMIPSTATPSVLEGFGGVPPIRPLETLHNALSLKQLDAFLEKMTTAPLFKTPASSPPKYPSTPVATPVQTPQNSVPDRSVQLPSWSGQSSMTSSMGCMSSEGPSSPIFSDAYSRGGGCPSSEMSASIASSDGAGFFAAAASSELSQMYPTLDDLGTIDSRFALDQFTVQASHGSANQSIGDTTHSDITPMSACSDCWEFNTNDATRGSTANEMLTEEEDEDATLSTDTCFSGLSDISKQVSVPTIPLNNTTIDTDSHPNASAPSGSVSKEIVFDFKNISNNIATKNNAENVKKVDNRARNTCIQKQISLYEKDCTTEYRNLALDLNKFMATPCNLEAPQCQNNGCSTSAAGATQVDLKFISADDLDKTITNVKQNLSAISFLESAANDKCPKTKACANLKVTPVPGAVMVRELFIEAPRMHATATSGQQPGQYNQRMTLSQSSGFMGRHSITEMEPSTSFPSVNASGAKRLNTFHRQSSVSGTSSSRPRFTTTKVCESELKDQPHMGQESREEYNQSDGVGGDTQQKKNDNN